MFDKLLIPVDGSAPAKRAAKFGLELAAVYDAAVDVLHVVDVGPREADEARERGTDLLEKVATLDVDGDPAVETHLTEGTPSEIIPTHVDKHGTDLVVMGRHGRSGITAHLLGSTTERVLRQVSVPVLTVPGESITPEMGRTYEDVVVTTDGSDVAEEAAPCGADIARHMGATLHLLTVVDVLAEAGPFDAGGVKTEYVERLKDEGQAALDRLADSTDTTDLDTVSSLVEGRTIDEIERYVDEHGIDLVAIASQGESSLVSQRLGSTTNRVLNAVERPVLVVPVSD